MEKKTKTSEGPKVYNATHPQEKQQRCHKMRRWRYGDTLHERKKKQLKKKHIVETRQQDHIMSEKKIMSESSCPFVVRLVPENHNTIQLKRKDLHA